MQLHACLALAISNLGGSDVCGFSSCFSDTALVRTLAEFEYLSERSTTPDALVAHHVDGGVAERAKTGNCLQTAPSDVSATAVRELEDGLPSCDGTARASRGLTLIWRFAASRRTRVWHCRLACAGYASTSKVRQWYNPVTARNINSSFWPSTF